MSGATDFYVYVLFRPNGVPCYVGKGRGRRMHRHGVNKSTNQRLARIIARSGGNLPRVKVREDITEAEAFVVERALIGALGREILVNFTDGGEGFAGGRHSPECRARMGVWKRGVSHSAEHAAAISAALKGQKRTPVTAEHRAKISAALRRPENVERLRQMNAALFKGRPLKLEHVEKVTRANLGKKRSQAARNAMGEAQKRRFEGCVGHTEPWLAEGISRRTWYRRRTGK